MRSRDVTLRRNLPPGCGSVSPTAPDALIATIGKESIMLNRPSGGIGPVVVDSNVGCSDGQADFLIAIGTCAEALVSGFFSSEAVLDRTAPFQVCVRRVSDPGHLSEYALFSYDSDSAALGPVGPAIVSVP